MLTTSNPSTAAPIVPLATLDRSTLPLAGGKAANLGELLQAGFPVPPGFCVTTAAYAEVAQLAGLERILAAAQTDTPEALEHLAAEARGALLDAPIPEQLAAAVRAAYAELSRDGEPPAVAVRSSATAEDLPDASFAGQQDTYLDVRGEAALLDAIRRCWASLWTDRAVAYRHANTIDQRAVRLAVVVQVMVPSATAGVLFTANPLTGRRQEAVIDAAPGLGEAVVSGVVRPDHFVVDTAADRIVDRTRGDEGSSGAACLTDRQVLELARLGARVEAHYGAPQDLEWAYDPAGTLWLLQARPITTLYTLPAGARADAHHLNVYFSFNVAQGVLGPLTPLGIATFQRFVKVAYGSETAVPLAEAGCRLFVDVTPMLRNRLWRRLLLRGLSLGEPRTGQAIQGLLDDPRLAPRSRTASLGAFKTIWGVLSRSGLSSRALLALRDPAHARAVALREVDRVLESDRGPVASPDEALDRVEALLDRLPGLAYGLLRVALPGLLSFALARKLAESIGSGDQALLVLRGLPYNPTTEMDLELWTLATRLRQDPQVAALLLDTPAPELAARYLRGDLPPLVRREVGQFLDRYGFRGVAEIDLGVPRWRDDPTYLFGVLSNYLRLDDPVQAPDAQFRRATAEADAAARAIVRRARRAGPFGPLRASLLRFLFDRARALAGLRERPKFTIVRAFGRCRELLLAVGAHLTRAGRLERPDDVFFLNLAEARQSLAGADLRPLVAERRQRYAREQRRRLVPRVLLSDGTTLYGNEQAAESGGLLGTPASPGTYRGRARVILDPAGARLEPGEVLVAPSTDPGWTPLFLTAGALVMEMGGMMSHGSVVAREYGIPAVVGAIGATTTVQTGQWITVDGTRGVVSLAPDGGQGSGVGDQRLKSPDP